MGDDDTFNLNQANSNSCYGDYGSVALDNAHDDCGNDIFNNDVNTTGYWSITTCNGGNGDDIFNGYSGKGTFNGENGEDIFNIYSGQYTINGGAGNDKIIANGGYGTFNGGDGDDYFEINTTTASTINGNNGDDKVYINQGTHTINGNNGDDYIEINTSNNKIYGGANEDTINIVSGDGNYVDGGGGTNAIVDNGTNTTKINVPGGTYSTTIAFAKKETKTDVEINGTTYTITNKANGANSLEYQIQDDGCIIFKSGNFTISANDKTISHYVELKGSSNDFYGGNEVDTILISSTSGTIHGLDGDDIIKSTGSYSATIYGDDGDDNIYSYGGTVYGGTGNDTISSDHGTIHGNEGDDIITNRGYCTSYGDEGNDKIFVSGNYAYVDAGVGDDTVIVTNSTYSNIFLGEGNDTLQLYSNLANYAYIDMGSGSNTIMGVKKVGDEYVEYNNRSISSNVTIAGEGSGNINKLTGTNSSVVCDDFENDEFTKVSLLGGETKTITINGLNYKITNKNTSAQTSVQYKYDAIQNKVILSGYNVDIIGTSNAPYSVDIYGQAVYFTGNNKDDIVTVYGKDCYVYGGEGNDTLTSGNSANGTRL